VLKGTGEPARDVFSSMLARDLLEIKSPMTRVVEWSTQEYKKIKSVCNELLGGKVQEASWGGLVGSEDYNKLQKQLLRPMFLVMEFVEGILSPFFFFFKFRVQPSSDDSRPL